MRGRGKELERRAHLPLVMLVQGLGTWVLNFPCPESLYLTVDTQPSLLGEMRDPYISVNKVSNFKSQAS